MANLNIAIKIAAQDKASGPIGKITGSLVDMKNTGLAGIQSAGKLALGGLAVGAGLLVTGLASVGTVVFGVSSDIDAATSDIKASLGSTAEEAERLGGLAAQVWGDNFAGSVTEAGGAIALVRQQLGDLADDELVRATENAFRLSDTFGADIPGSIDAANTLMENFGLTSDEAFDFIASGYQKGLDRSGDFLDSIGEYSTQFASGEASAGQFFSLMENGMQGGMLGTDRAADAFKEFRVRIQDGSKLTAESLDAIGISSQELYDDMADGSVTAADAFTIVTDALNEVDDQNVLIQAGVGLLGTQFEDLGTDGALSLSLIGTEMEDLEGAAGSLDAKYDNLGDMWDGFKRKGLLALSPLSDMVLDIAKTSFADIFDSAALTSGIDRVSSQVRFFTDDLEDGVPFIEAFFGAMEGIGFGSDVLVPMRQFAIGLQDIIDRLPAFIANVQNAISPITDWISENIKLSDVFIAVGIAVATIVVPALFAIVSAAAPLVLGFAQLVAVVALMRTAWETDFGGIRDFVAGVWAGIQQGFDAFKLLFAGDWQGFLDGIGAAWGTIWNSVITFLGNLWGMAEPYLSSWYQSFLTWFQSQDWAALAQTAIDFIVLKLGEFWVFAQPYLMSWYQSFLLWFQETDWAMLAQTALDFIVLKLGEFWTFAQPIVQGWFTSIWDWFQETDWAEVGLIAMTAIIEALKTFWTKAGPVVSGWYTAFVSWASEQDWGAIATNIVKAIAAGLFGAQALIINALGGIVSGAWAAVISQFGGGGDAGSTGTSSPGGGGFASGGFTGIGAASQVAGFVHRGEYVFNQDAVNRIGVPALNDLHSMAQSSGGSASISATASTATAAASTINYFGDINVTDKATGQALLDLIRGTQDKMAVEAFA